MGTDYLDRPLRMPSFPSHDTPVEIEDTPGSRLPTEPLLASPEGRAVLRRQKRLHIASRLLAAAASNLLSDMVRNGTQVPADTPRLLDTCRKYGRAAVLLADALIELNDEFDRTPPAAPAAEQLPLTRNDHSYLLWLSNFDAVPPSAVCPPLGPDMSAKCRRRLMQLGYVVACKWEDTHGFGISPAGRQLVDLGQCYDVLKLGEIDEGRADCA